MGFFKDKIGLDPHITKILLDVEKRKGLSLNLMWALNWYDRRYKRKIGGLPDNLKGLVYYCETKHYFWQRGKYRKKMKRCALEIASRLLNE